MDITNPVIREYIASVMPERSEALQELHDYAVLNDVPIIKHEMEQFLTFIVTMHRPLRILEIGTAIGYSAIVMAKASSNQAEIITLEKSDKMVAIARDNFSQFDLNERIEVVPGDAVLTIKALEQPFDLIFMDAAKGQYMNFYEDALRLLKPGGLLIADNILQDGLVAKSRFAIPRRQRTIHSRMRLFVKSLMEHPELTTSVLSIADGGTISIRNKASVN